MHIHHPHASLLKTALMVLLSSVASGLWAGAMQAPPPPEAPAHIQARYTQLPLSFEANQGQTDPRVKFLSRGPGYALFLTPTEAVLALHPQAPVAPAGKARPAAPGLVLHLQLAGANPQPQVVGLEALPGKVNYFLGKDPTRWRTGVPTYAKVSYAQVYPGIDLLYYGHQRQVEYDFAVAPGADPKAITLLIEGERPSR